MTREDYIRLRSLPDNKMLSEYDFHMKYQNLGLLFEYHESNKIENLEDFKGKMNSLKSKIDKKVIEC